MFDFKSLGDEWIRPTCRLRLVDVDEGERVSLQIRFERDPEVAHLIGSIGIGGSPADDEMAFWEIGEIRRALPFNAK